MGGLGRNSEVALWLVPADLRCSYSCDCTVILSCKFIEFIPLRFIGEGVLRDHKRVRILASDKDVGVSAHNTLDRRPRYGSPQGTDFCRNTLQINPERARLGFGASLDQVREGEQKEDADNDRQQDIKYSPRATLDDIANQKHAASDERREKEEFTPYAWCMVPVVRIDGGHIVWSNGVGDLHCAGPLV